MPEDYSQHPKATYEDWERLAEATLSGVSLSSLEKSTEDGIPLYALYTSRHQTRNGGAPVAVPREWMIAQRIEPQASEKALNAAMLDELAGGAQRIEFPSDMDISLLPGALRDVLVGAVSFSIEPGPDTGAATAAICSAYAEAGVDPKDANASLGADPWAMLASGIMDKTEAGEALKSTLNWMKEAGAGLPCIRPFAVAGDLYHQLGLTAAGELAAVLAGTVAILRAGEDQGGSLDELFRRMEFRLAAEPDIYLTIAKTRALRQGLRQVAEACGISDPGLGERVHGITSARHLTTVDADTNILRNGTAMLGLVLGGAGIITCLAHDWLTGSSARGRRLARNSHHLMRDEARLGQIADPAAGAYFLDRFTMELGAKAWALFQEIEGEGGLAESLVRGKIDRWAEEASSRRQQEVNSGKSSLLGVTLHPVMGASSAQVLATSFGPRGGACRPSGPWEELRARTEGKGLRVLLLDLGESRGAGATSRWFQAIGINATAMKTSADEAIKIITAASPDLIVTDGVDAAIARQISGMAVPPRHLEAGAFKGDVLALLEKTLGGKR
ncbi:methylmalonyl-CoA mutase family protein [Alphaproteobacteria bacterium LSUCC0684]